MAALLAPWCDSRPLFPALASGVRALALDGRLAVGARLPSERSLADALGVSRTTVSATYDELRGQGWLHSAHGAGTHLAWPAPAPVRPDAEADDPAGALDLTVASMPAPAGLLDAVHAATADLVPLLAGHGLHPFGLPSLRRAVAEHLGRRGLATDPEQVMITGGALAGWDLLLRTTTRPGQRVIVEQPTYPAVLDAVRAHHLRPLALPVDAGGWGVPPRGRAVLAHVTPDAQNPTGLLADDDQRRCLLAALDAQAVVVDETFADLVLDGPAPAPLAALDGRVTTLGSMSKAFWAGLRVGWVRGDPALLRRLAQQRASVDLAGPVLDQLVAARVLADAEALLDERRAWLRRSRDALVAALARHLPTWEIEVPRAGLVLWAAMPEPSATRLASHALDLGLRLSPGPRFTPDGTADRWLRLPFTVAPERADDLAATVALAAERAGSGRPAPHASPRWTA